MGIGGSKLDLMRQRLFIPVTEFSGLQQIAFTPTTGTPVPVDTLLASAGAGNALLEEIGTTGLMALVMVSAADDIAHTMIVPSDWDRHQPIYVRVIWASEAAAVGDRDITWKFMYAELTPGVTAIAAPTTVLDTVLVAQAPLGTAKTFERSATAGKINANAIADASLYWSFIVEMDAFDAAFTEDKYLIGVELEYTPKPGAYSAHSQREGLAWVA